MKLEEKLLEEVNRFHQINKYGKKLVTNEQVAPPPPLPPDAAPIPAPVPPPDAALAPPVDVPPAPANETEEVDVTDLVNMTKNIKKDLETSKKENDGVISKMDDVFNKLNDLESKLAQMDNLLVKIDSLSTKVETMKEPTAVEKLEMRSLDSYPFNQNPQQFFQEKQSQMKATGKNEYVLTNDDVANYGKEEMQKSFNPSVENEFKF
jgi:hypothetical protein